MAPRKKTEEKSSGNEAADLVLQYLRQENRPYSATDVSANLHNKVTKATATKTLKDLFEQKLIEGRASGKQIVYHALQSSSSSCSPGHLTELDNEINTLQASTTDLQTKTKTLRCTLTVLMSELSTVDLVAGIHALSSGRADILSRLANLNAGKARRVTQEERQKVDKQWKRSESTTFKRQRIANNMWTFIADHIADQECREEMKELLGLNE